MPLDGPSTYLNSPFLILSEPKLINKCLFSLVLALGMATIWSPRIEAVRRVDPGKTHAFTHGEQKCVDCHKDLKFITFHPDPKNLNTKLKDFYGLVASPEKSSCKRCHFTGNTVGEAARSLPSEGLICILCHPAALSPGSALMTLSLLIFGFGLFSLILFWFRAARIRENESGLAKKIFRGTRTVTGVLFSRKIILIFKTLWVDVLLNRRFFKLAPGRWLIHGLIFYPFLFRITWGLAALICSAIAPQWSVTRIIVDQNHPLTALLFDLTGILIIMGALGAIARRLFRKSIKIPDLPPPDWLAMGLLGLLLINGFMLEGVRMAMSGIGFPGSTKSAFLGMAISQAATGSRELSSAYVEFWYFHTLVAAVFIAYLPFSRFRHIFMAPLFLIMKTVLKKET